MGTPDFVAVVAAVLAVVLLLDISALWLTGRQVPELLSELTFGIFGFYFGRMPVVRQPVPEPEPTSKQNAEGG
jgi:hypothetical protein